MFVRRFIPRVKGLGFHTASCIDPRISETLTNFVARKVFVDPMESKLFAHRYPTTTFSKDDWKIVVGVMLEVAEEYYNKTGKPYPFLLWVHNDCKAVKIACDPSKDGDIQRILQKMVIYREYYKRD